MNIFTDKYFDEDIVIEGNNKPYQKITSYEMEVENNFFVERLIIGEPGTCFLVCN